MLHKARLLALSAEAKTSCSPTHKRANARAAGDISQAKKMHYVGVAKKFWGESRAKTLEASWHKFGGKF